VRIHDIECFICQLLDAQFRDELLKKPSIRFLIVPHPKRAVPKVKRAQTAASDPKKRRPTRISEREIDLERAAEGEAEMSVRALAPWLRRLTPIVRPDQDLHVQLANERHPRIADEQLEIWKHQKSSSSASVAFARRALPRCWTSALTGIVE
jgi:hypothetical protein